jgi:hypothetical protein
MWLKRLDRPTREADAQLKVKRYDRYRVMDVADNMLAVDNRVKDVNKRARVVDDKIAAVHDGAACIAAANPRMEVEVFDFRDINKQHWRDLPVLSVYETLSTCTEPKESGWQRRRQGSPVATARLRTGSR